MLQAKFGAAVGLIQRSDDEKHLERVAEITDLQGPVFGHTKVDAEKLLKIRESGDCRAFRDWLANTTSLADKEIKDRVRGLNAQIRHAISNTPGKVLRFLVSLLIVSFRRSRSLGRKCHVGETFSGADFKEGLEAVEKLRGLLPEGVSMSQFALRWILMFDAVTYAIPGGKRPEQVADNCRASELPILSDETMTAVRDLYNRKIRPLIGNRW